MSTATAVDARSHSHSSREVRHSQLRSPVDSTVPVRMSELSAP